MKRIKYLPMFAFCIMVFLIPIMYIVTPDSDFSPLEKRKLSQMPEPTVSKVFSGEFGEQFETYLSDQVPLRTFFVGLNSYYNLFSGRNGIDGIYKGKDNYLFVAPVKENPTFDRNLGYICEFLDDISVPSYVCIVPSSGFIYSDMLPANHYDYNDDKIIDKAFSELSSNTTVPINITDSFMSLSKNEQLYYKTDHHWTSLGAYECYKLLGEKMNFNPTPKEKFAVQTYSGFKGTNYSKSALWNMPSENIELWKSSLHKEGDITVTFTENGTTSEYNTMFFKDNLYGDDMYTAFLDGNHAMVNIKNPNVGNNKKLLILRDSYTHCLAPFLADNYSEITLIDVRYYLSPVSELIKENKTDEVLLIYSIDSIVNSTDLAGIY